MLLPIAVATFIGYSVALPGLAPLVGSRGPAVFIW